MLDRPAHKILVLFAQDVQILVEPSSTSIVPVCKQQRLWQVCAESRPPDKSVYWKIIFLISQPKHGVVGTHRNRLNETVLLSTQNTC